MSQFLSHQPAGGNDESIGATTSTERVVRSEIEATGPLSFARFMELSLYGRDGFYRRGANQIGTPASFYTSPAVHPAFGALMALQIEEMWRLLGAPEDFTVAEAGAGSGQLAADIEAYARTNLPDLAAALRYITIDIGDTVGRLGIASPIKSHGLPLHGMTGILLAHELWDNIPLMRVVRTSHGWDEIRIAIESGKLAEVRRPLENHNFELALVDSETRTDLGAEIELRPQLDRWIGEAAEVLDRGYLISVDYGYLDPVAFRLDHPRGSVMAYRNQEVSESPLNQPGEWDITAHVNFDAAFAAGRTAGFDAESAADQRTFLINLGLEPMLGGLHALELDQTTLQRNSMGMRELIRPDGFGRFVVAVFAKNAPHNISGMGYPAIGRPQATTEAGRKRPDPTVPLMNADHFDLVAGRYPHQALDPGVIWNEAGRQTCESG